MKLRSELPVDRVDEGRFTVFSDDGRVLLGPVRCRGKADNALAWEHANPQRDPVHPYGDHPFGTYRIVEVHQPDNAHSFGPWLVRLAPVSGEAFEARQNGRTGLEIHGGELGREGVLRPTEGCLRVDDTTMDQLAAVLVPALREGQSLFYEAVPLLP